MIAEPGGHEASKRKRGAGEEENERETTWRNGVGKVLSARTNKSEIREGRTYNRKQRNHTYWEDRRIFEIERRKHERDKKEKRIFL